TRPSREPLAVGMGAGAGVDPDLLRAQARLAASSSRQAALYDRLARLAAQGGHPGLPNDFLLYLCIGAILGLLLGWLRTGSFLWGLGAAAAVGAAPILFLLWKRQKRMQRFEAQFPDALDAMSRAIRAGNALSSAIQLVGQEMPNPL